MEESRGEWGPIIRCMLVRTCSAMHMQRAGFPQNQQTLICTTQRAIVYGHVHGPLHTIACGYFRRKLSRAMYAMGHHLQLNSTQLPAEISTCNCMQWPAMYMANHIIYALPWSIGWCISTRHHRHCTCGSIPLRPCAESIPCVPKAHVVVAVEAQPASMRPPEPPLPTFGGGGGNSDDFAFLFALLAELEAGGVMIEPSKHP